MRFPLRFLSALVIVHFCANGSLELFDNLSEQEATSAQALLVENGIAAEKIRNVPDNFAYSIRVNQVEARDAAKVLNENPGKWGALICTHRPR